MTTLIRNRLLWLHTACFTLMLFFTAQAQAQKVSGTVKDVSGKPVPGVTVVIEGTGKGTATNADGMFTLNDVPPGAMLSFSFIGYQTQKVRAGSGPVNITIKENATELDQLVVVGYGTRRKADVTGAVSQVSVTKLENENPTSVQDALRGNISGLSVTGNNSAKGGGSLIIRGRSSIHANPSPLIVMDGVIYPGSLSDINPNDIQTIDVLKDASSAAVFGAKSAKGIILITTKKGNKSKPTITLNANTGISPQSTGTELSSLSENCIFTPTVAHFAALASTLMRVRKVLKLSPTIKPSLFM